MKAFAITNPGLEEYAAKETEELIHVETKTEKSVVLFEADEQKLAYLCYRSQSLIKVCSLIDSFKINSAKDLKKIRADFTKIIKKGKTFRVKFAKQGKNELLAQEIEPELGSIIIDQFKTAPKVEMENPDYVVYLYVFNNNAYVGIDYSGFDLSKREYRIFANPRSFKGNVAFCLLRIAELKEKEILLDPFCLSGEVGIEAALYLTKRSPHYFSKQKFAFNKFTEFDFEKVDRGIKKINGTIVISSPFMSDVKAAQKNAKIAAVEKEIDFTRQDVEWLDFKLKRGSVDKVVTMIPCPSAAISEASLKKTYEHFFFQMKEILSKKGKVVVLGKNLDYFKKAAKNVKLKKEISFFNGAEKLEISIFDRI